MSVKCFINPAWRALLAARGLDHFDGFWQVAMTLVDEPNRRRNGESEVGLMEFAEPSGEVRRVYVKRQRNFRRRSLRHPLRGISTTAFEFEHMRAFAAAGVESMTPVFFGLRRAGGNEEAILVTEALEGFRPLDDYQSDQARQTTGVMARRRLLKDVACYIRRLHQSGWVHHALYPKHVFVRPQGEGFAVRLIDLETARRSWLARGDILRDLGTMARRSCGWSRTERLYFLKCYLGEAWPAGKRRLLQRLAREIAGKRG